MRSPLTARSAAAASVRRAPVLHPGQDRHESDGPLKIYTFLVLVVGAIMVGRLYQRSVLEHDYYWKLAQRQQYSQKEVLAERGLIYVNDASAGTPALLAGNVERYALGVTPREVKDPKKAIEVLVKDLGLEADVLRKKLTYEGGVDWPSGKGYWTPPLYHGLTKDQARSLAANLGGREDLTFDFAQGDIMRLGRGFHLIKEYQRSYLENQLAANVVGYVNADGQGQYGIEGAWQAELTGAKGKVEVERDSRGRLLGDFSSLAARNGTSYVLTIDRNVQYHVEQILDQAIKDQEADSGVMVVLGAKTGAVLAMASRPTFNPNEYNKVPSDQMAAFRNLATSARYEFGSVYKTFTIAMAINEGLTTPDEVGNYPASVTIAGHRIGNVGNKAYPGATTTQALENSVNTAMIELSNRLGTERFHDYLTRLGLGEKTGIELSGEVASPLIAKKDMHDVQRATISFGQGIANTALQVAAAHTAITNDGVLLRPHVIDSIIYPDGTTEQRQPIVAGEVFTPDTARQMREMLASVVVHGHSKRAAIPGYQIGGKTGTAQIARPEGGYYGDRYRHSFALIAPADDSQFIIFMSLDYPKHAEFAESSVSEPSAAVAKYLLSYYQIPPTNR